MTRFGVLGATALSLSLAIATPVLAQQAHGNKAGAHAAGNMGGARMGGGPRMQSNFRGAQGNVGAANFAGRGNAQFAQRGNAQFAQRGEFRGDRGRYDNGATFNSGLPLVTFGQQAPVDQMTVASGGDASYCAQRYRSFDPASGTYLGYDGLRHPCQ
jgi:hypothetical protein